MNFYLVGMIIATIFGLTDKNIDKDKDNKIIISVIALLSWVSVLYYLFLNYSNKSEM